MSLDSVLLRKDVFKIPAEKVEKHEVKYHHANEASNWVVLELDSCIWEQRACAWAFKGSERARNEIDSDSGEKWGSILSARRNRRIVDSERDVVG